METLRAPHPKSRGKYDLDRTIKLNSTLPILLLRKPLSSNTTKAKDLKSFDQQRLDRYDTSNWMVLVDDYEKDVVATQTLHRDDIRSQSDKDEARIWEVAELLSRFQCSKA